MKKIELLAPAGDPEKMRYAIHYGADAVYAGLGDFSLRCRINKFTPDKIKEAIEFVHENGKKIYVTVNIFAHNRHIEGIREHLEFLKQFDIDGVIAADPGVVSMVREILPNVEAHLSTQANTTNWKAVEFWKKQGVSRVILAREVSLDEIKEIKKNVPEMDLEAFVHGAMCMSYSGRCMLSSYMLGRSANLGDCVQPCRWLYKDTDCAKGKKVENVVKMNVADYKGEFEIDIEEDEHGTYFLNSRDMNMIEYVDKLIETGVSSLKIEGRNKSVYYLALVIRAYRRVIDALENKLSKKEIEKIIVEEKENLDSLVNRGYSTGFFFGSEPGQVLDKSHQESKFEFAGEIIGEKDGLVEVKVHNAIYLKDELDIIDKEGNHKIKLEKIYDHNMQEVESAHGGHDNLYYMKIDKKEILPMSLIRRAQDRKK